MAKKKTATPKEPTQMQLDALATFLKQRGGNVFTVCVGFNVDPKLGDQLFDLLEKKTNTFKCENCDEWMDLSHKVDGMGDSLFCNSCVDEMDGKDPQHEDD